MQRFQGRRRRPPRENLPRFRMAEAQAADATCPRKFCEMEMKFLHKIATDIAITRHMHVQVGDKKLGLATSSLVSLLKSVFVGFDLEPVSTFNPFWLQATFNARLEKTAPTANARMPRAIHPSVRARVLSGDGNRLGIRTRSSSNVMGVFLELGIRIGGPGNLKCA